MSATLNFEKIKKREKILSLTDTIKIECKTEAIGVSEVVAITPIISSHGEEISSGQVKYAGRLIFTACLQAENGLKKVECATEFLGTLKNEKIQPDYLTKTCFEVVKIEHVVMNGYLIITATVHAKVDFYSELSTPYACGGENIILKTKTTEIAEGLGEKSFLTTIEEEFQVNKLINEVIFHKEDAVVTAVSCGIGCIIVDGEISINLFVLQNDKKSDILKENKTLPFRLEIDYPDAMPTNLAVANAYLNGTKIDVTAFEETTSSTINVNLSILLKGEVIKTEEKSLVIDAFSKNEELELHNEKACFFKPTALLSYEEKFCENVAIDNINDLKLTAIMPLSLKVVDNQLKEDLLLIDFIAQATAFFVDDDLNAFAKSIEFPITISKKCESADEFEVLSSFISDINAKIVNENQLEVYGEIKFAVKCDKLISLAFIDGIEIKGEKPTNLNAFSVYLPLKDEELWDLSKRLCISPEELLENNPELNFPLTGEERIIIYRQRKKEYS